MPIDRAPLNKLLKEYEETQKAYKGALGAVKDCQTREKDAKARLDKSDDLVRANLQKAYDEAKAQTAKWSQELDTLGDRANKLRTDYTSEQTRINGLIDAEVEKVLKQKPALVKEAASLKAGLEKVLKALPGKEKDLKKAKKKSDLEKLENEVDQLRTSEKNMRAALKKAEDAVKALDAEAKRVRESA